MTDTTDLVARLRSYAKDQGGWHAIDETCEEAADAIERLTKERDAARVNSDKWLKLMKAQEVIFQQDADSHADFCARVAAEMDKP